MLRLVILWALLWTGCAQARDLLREPRIDQRPGAQVPLDLRLQGEEGQSLTLRQWLADKPALLVPGYSACPMLCRQVDSGLLDSLRALDWTAGQEFRVLSISIDPREGPAQAARHRQAMLSRYDRPLPADGWRFLTGTPDELTRLLDTIGYQVVYDRQSDQFAHPAGLVVLTPDGRVSSYLEGISFSARAIRRALAEAGRGRIVGATDPVRILCFQYDPHTGRYSLAVVRLVQLLSALTVVVLALVLGNWHLRERRRAC